MKYQLIIVFICLVFSCTRTVSPDELERLIKESVVEGKEESFTNIPGSEEYIKNFSLNEDEIKIIGSWGFEGILCKIPKDNKYGPGIGITFYPNRSFRVYKNNRDNGQIKSTYGEWKIANKKLLVKFEAKLVIVAQLAKNNYEKYNIEYYNDEKYYPIFQIPAYERAFYNTEAFRWNALPRMMRTFFEILLEDGPRSRLLFDPLGDPPGNIRPNSKYGKLLLNPQKTKEYYVDLLDIW
jgi:hypothetical protein